MTRQAESGPSIVHGGRGTPPAGGEARRNEICGEAAEAGYQKLLNGGSALEACEVAIRVMEASKLLNAGLGAYLQADGRARVDASIMTGDGRAGAVVQVPFLAYPIQLAGYLLREKFYGVDEDAHAFAEFIVKFLSKYDRRNSPKSPGWPIPDHRADFEECPLLGDELPFLSGAI